MRVYAAVAARRGRRVSVVVVVAVREVVLRTYVVVVRNRCRRGRRGTYVVVARAVVAVAV